MANADDAQIDDLDMEILALLEDNGRIPLADVSRKTGTSRAFVWKRLQRLLDQQITRIAAFTNPVALGYGASVIIGIKAILSEIDETAECLRNLENITLVFLTTGRYDIVVLVMLRTNEHLPDFLRSKLGYISGIEYVETIMVVETEKMEFSFVKSTIINSLSKKDRSTGLEHVRSLAKPVHAVNDIDLTILKEMENNGRQTISGLAKKLGVSRKYARKRLEHLIDNGSVRITAFTNPLRLGYNTFATIGIKVSPQEITNVGHTLSENASALWVVAVAGRYDLLVWAVFKAPMELSTFITSELSNMRGVRSAETMVLLALRKWSFAHLASSHPTVVD